MRFSSLPNEILVDVFRRLDSESVEQVSNVNRRFNKIVRSHKLYKPIVDCINIVEYCDGEHLQIIFTLSLKDIVRQMPIQLKQENPEATQKQMLLQHIKKLPITGTRTLDVVLGPINFDMVSVFRDAGLNLRFLVKCITTSPITLNFVDDVFLNNLMPTKQVEPIFFENCCTSISFKTIVKYIANFEGNLEIQRWNFGILSMTEADEHLLADFLKSSPLMYHKSWKNPRTRRITHKIGRQQKSKTTQGGFYWQNSETLDTSCFNRKF